MGQGKVAKMAKYGCNQQNHMEMPKHPEESGWWRSSSWGDI
jgi:hypothetical protein